MQFFLPPPHHITSHRHTNLWAKTHAAVKYLLMQCTTRHMTTLGIGSGKFYEKYQPLTSQWGIIALHLLIMPSVFYSVVTEKHRSTYYNYNHISHIISTFILQLSHACSFLLLKSTKFMNSQLTWLGKYAKKCVCTININSSPDLFTLYFFVLTRFLKSLLVYIHICMKSWIKNWIGIVTTT